MKRKKIISLIMSVILITSALLPASVFAQAAGTITVTSVNDVAGATVNVAVKINNNPGILGATLTVEFGDGLNLLGATKGAAFSALTMTPPGQLTSPCRFLFAGDSLSEDDITDGNIMILKFKISDDAQAGTKYPVNISYEENSDILDIYMNPINPEVKNGEVEVLAFIYGDLNSDKRINTTDGILISREVAGGYNLTINKQAADVNVDTKINTTDVILMRRHLAGGYGITFPYIPAGCNHVMEEFPAKEATEEETGNIAYWYCKACKKYFSDEKGNTAITLEETVIPMLPKSEYSIQYMCDMVPLGTDNKPITYEPDTYKPTQTKVLPTPKMDKYEFLGWSDQNGIMYGTEIPQGNTGDLVLYANWVSSRNKAVKKSKLGDPIILEDSTEGVLLFAYEIGTIENVPLYTTLDLQCANGIITTNSVSEQEEIYEENAIEIAETISNATTNTTSWSLSNDWEKTTEKGSEMAQTNSETNEDYNSRMNSSIFTKSESNSSSGSNSYINTNSSSYNISANQAHRTDWGVETESNHEYTTDDKISANIGAEIGAGWGPVSAKVEAGISTESSVHESTNNKINTTNSGTDSWDTHMDSSQSNTNSSTNSKTWNSSSASSISNNVTSEEGYRNILSKEIAEKYHYGETFAEGGSKSESADFALSETTTEGRKSTVAYHTSKIATKTREFTSTGNTFGNYRMVQAGTMHVFAVVGYDVATGQYFTYTYNILDDTTHEYLDYSYDGTFSDYESSVIPFEVPYYVNDYVNNRIYRTEGLKLNPTTGMIVGYEPTDKNNPDNIVIIPTYWQIDNNDGTFSSVKIKGIVPGLFENNTDIIAVKLGKFITEIPDNTFNGCTNLEYIMAPSITCIGDNAFSGCESLAEFKISGDITNVGDNAFVNIPSVTAVASTVDVAKAIAKSGARNIVLDISKIPEEENNNLKIEIDEIDSFKLIGQSKEYKGLSVKSNAVTTVINGITFTDNTEIPIELSSENVTLDNITVICNGYAMALKASEVNISLNKEVNLISNDENAVISKTVNLSELNSSYVGNLNVTGNVLICGTINDNGLLNFNENKGEIIYLTQEEYENYLTSRKVTFEVGEGFTDTEYVIIPYNSNFGELPTASRDYHTFEGWYLTPQETDGEFIEENRINQITAESTMTSLTDLTLYAHWQLGDISPWTLKSDMPADAQVVDTKYSYTLTEYTTSGSSSVSGWEKYNETWEWGSWGAWSSWGTTQYYDSDSRDAESRWIAPTYKTQYNYYGWKGNGLSFHFCPVLCKQYYNTATRIDSGWMDYPLSSVSLGGTQKCACNPSHGTHSVYYQQGSNRYFHTETRTVEATAGYTQWCYRDRSKVYTYYFKRNLNKESATNPTGDNISNVQEWVQYRTK